jgi:hypothetical protein
MLGMNDRDYKKVLDKHNRKRSKRNKLISSALIILAVVILAVFSYALFEEMLTGNREPAGITKQVQPPISPRVYTIPTEVSSIVDSTGIDRSELSKIRVDGSEDLTECRKMIATASACYTNKTIKYPFSNVSTKSQLENNKIFSHEYLHYIWGITPAAQKDSLRPYIKSLYDANRRAFDVRFQGYFNGGIQAYDEKFFNEWHSIMGTEIADWRLPKPLLDHYTKHLPNRNALPSYY